MSLKVNRDDANVTNDGKLLQMRAAATGQARSPIVLWRVTRTSTAVNAGMHTQNSNLCDHNPPTSQTDGQTTEDCALHYSAPCSKNRNNYTV